MVLKKSDLYSSLWKSCDELRGGMDASQYKDYILTLLFVKYVTDKYGGDESGLIEVPAGGSFNDMVALKGDKEIGDKINKIIAKLAEANDLQGVIDVADFNDEDKLGRGKDMQDRLSKLVTIFDSLDLRASRPDGDDLLGDAYEYLMRHFATQSGKSKGQFYTPSEVSRILAKVVGVDKTTRQDQTIYDPAAGSGSLLLKAAEEAPHGITIYGQEMDVATWALAKMNMILHGHPTADLWRGNTLAAPYFKNKDGSLKTFDFAVMNPPFSSKSWTNGFDPAHDEFRRFEYGIPPAKNGDYAFLLHVIASLKSTGKAAVILPHGVLFRGNREADIRRRLVRHGLIKGIIGLPPNLFYGTGIPACVVVIDKENARSRTGIFMINASQAFMKDGAKNRLRAQDIHKIVDVFNNQRELPRYSRMVPVAEISSPENNFNLNIARYIDSSEAEDIQDLDAHLNGGIPVRDVDALESFWSVFPSLRKTLFRDSGRGGYCEANVDIQQVKSTIVDNPDFEAFAQEVRSVVGDWSETHRSLLENLKSDTRPKDVIEVMSEDLLGRFVDVRLLSRYDVYQRLMDYWASIMQDDVFLIVADDWVDAAQPREVINDKERNIKESPDLVVGRKKYKMDLVPPGLVISRYFSDEQDAIDDASRVLEEASQRLEEFVEENTGEDGLLEDVTNDQGKATKTAINARLKEIGDDAEFADEREALEKCRDLLEAESKAKRKVRDFQGELDKRVLANYAELTEEEVKTLVVNDKWFTSVLRVIEGEVQRLTHELTNRIKELELRYAQPLPTLENEVEELGAKVEEHLRKMGLTWG